ncbi:MAG: PDZ domain-containing protein [Clostridiales bacterium]|nr:PDZ domain-containing protein [Clostridiales bacterium]
MVLIHELGHYTTAKILGFTVEEFSVGFGPKIFSRTRKNGEVFSLRLLPLGGFCSFLGDTDDDENPADKKPEKDSINPDPSGEENPTDDLLSHVMREKAEEDLAKLNLDKDGVKKQEKPVRLDKDGNPAKTFYQQKPWKRIIVLLGGVVFNFLSAIVFSFIYIWAVGCAVPYITDVYENPDGAPYCAVQKGDIILGVNGKNISVMNSYSDLASGFNEGDKVTLRVSRNGEQLDIEVVRQQIAALDADGNPLTYVGFGFATVSTFANGTAGNAFKYCVPYTFKLSWSILGSFGQLISGKVPITSVSGPVGSIKLMADVSIANWRNILILLPLLASNLAMFNIIPFPALDGAQIVFTVIEWIRKKPINRKVQGIINFVGLIVLLLFVLIVDILSFVL